MRALLLVGILAAGAFALSGCGSAKIDEAKNPVQYDAARDGVPEVIGPGGKKGPKGGMMNKPGGGGTAVPDGK